MQDKLSLFYKTVSLKDLLYAVFGLSIAYTKGAYSLEYCKEQIKLIVALRR